jgi:hemerythrin
LEKLRDLDLNIPLEDQGRLAFELLLLISEWIVKHIQGDDFAYINCIDKYLNPKHLN